MTKPDIIHATYIVTTPEKLWATLTGADTRSFFHRLKSDWKAGSPWRLVIDDNPGDCPAQGHVLVSEPPRKLSMTWQVNPDDPSQRYPPSIVTFEAEPMGSGVVRLALTETNPEPIADEALRKLREEGIEGGREGWSRILSKVKTLLETGNPMPNF